MIMSEYKSIDHGYEFESFIRDYKRVNNVEEVDFKAVLARYFDGDLDEYVTEIDFGATDAEFTASEKRQRANCIAAITAITLASARFPILIRNVLHAFLGNGAAEPFLLDLGKALDGEVRDLLRHASRDLSIPVNERRVLARLAEIDTDALIHGTENFGDECAAPDDLASDASDFPARIFDELRAGAFPNAGRRLTVTEARRRLAEHTGQSERAVIRQTKGRTADEIIRLIA
ncbi:hypothetical protein C0214_23960 [Methylobacterium sp. DM1]|nr:hypothetical protein C0214_23960 [Methylobacterium sp. DM1]